jgi:hypothetical protein
MICAGPLSGDPVPHDVDAAGRTAGAEKLGHHRCRDRRCVVTGLAVWRRRVEPIILE